jgi:hypothetical protein
MRHNPFYVRRLPPFPSRPAAHGSRILRRTGLSLTVRSTRQSLRRP